MSNAAIAEHLSTVSQLYALENEPFKASAYSKASRVVADEADPVDGSNASSLPGIGRSIALAIHEFLTSGECVAYQKLTAKYPPEALTMTKVPGIGVKTALKFYHERGIKNIDELVKAIEDGVITDAKLVNAVKFANRETERVPLIMAWSLALNLLAKVRACPGVIRAEPAGSLRRCKETIRDLDIVAIADEQHHNSILAKFATFGEVLSQGTTKTSIRLSIKGTPIQADLVLVEKESFGAAMNYLTGSKEHNVTMRGLARKRGWKVNEFGIFDALTEKKLGGEHEQDLYTMLGVPYHPPELREGSQLWDTIPQLLTPADLTHDWHHHSWWSHDADKDFSIDKVAAQAKSLGRTLVAITDHSYSPHFKPNLKDAVKQYHRECRDAQEKHGIQVLCGVEVDIMADGTLQWPDDVLSGLDYVLAAIHKKHDFEVHSRLMAAVKHASVDAIAHPTGRMFGSRPAAEADWELLFQEAGTRNVAFEINGARMDLDSDLAYRASLQGCKLTLSSDCHGGDSSTIAFALMVARRAGLTKADLFSL